MSAEGLPRCPSDGRRLTGASDRVIGDWLNFATDDQAKLLLEFLPTLVDDSWTDRYRCEPVLLRPTNTRAIFVRDELIVVVVHAIEYPGFVQVIYVGEPGLPWTWH